MERAKDVIRKVRIEWRVKRKVQLVASQEVAPIRYDLSLLRVHVDTLVEHGAIGSSYFVLA